MTKQEQKIEARHAALNHGGLPEDDDPMWLWVGSLHGWVQASFTQDLLRDCIRFRIGLIVPRDPAKNGADKPDYDPVEVWR